MHRKGETNEYQSGSATNQDQNWVVVHDAERDHYELPIALAEVGMLERFVTDWYTPLDQVWWRRFARTRMARSTFGISKRFRPELPSRLTADNKLEFVSTFVRRKLFQRFFLNDLVGGKTGHHAASIANKNNAHLLAASYCAATAFENLRPDLKKVLFQVHPHPRYLRCLYESHIKANPDFAGLAKEPETLVCEDDLLRWEQESKLADHILCASEFTRRSLELSGIEPGRISVVPYGIDTDVFCPGSPSIPDQMNVLYVGQKVARKGLRLLLRVWQELQPAQARLVLAGGHVRDEDLLQGFNHLFTETPRISSGDLIKLFQQADVFVLPSLAEGFGHVYLEALACGVPVICTQNTGAADIIRHGESGWVLPAGDAAALADCLAWVLSHRRQVRDMREAARAVAEKYSWQRFRQGIREALLPSETEIRLRATSVEDVAYQTTVPVPKFA